MGPAVPFNCHQKGPLNGARQVCLFCVAASTMYHMLAGLRHGACFISQF